MIRKDHPKYFFSRDETERLTEAIRLAESKTTGRIQIYLEWRCPVTDPLSRSIKLFHQLKLDSQVDRNAALIYFATKYRFFAVIADKGISRKVPGNFWTELQTSMERLFKEGKFLEGTLFAVNQISRRLAENFPPQRQFEPPK